MLQARKLIHGRKTSNKSGLTAASIVKTHSREQWGTTPQRAFFGKKAKYPNLDI
jgi:hypothetical protein